MYVFRPSDGAGGILWMAKIEIEPDNKGAPTPIEEGQPPRSYWRPRLWVALTTVITFLLGVYICRNQRRRRPPYAPPFLSLLARTNSYHPTPREVAKIKFHAATVAGLSSVAADIFACKHFFF